MRIAVLVSGNGSNLQALIDAQLSGQIVGVISNKANAYALQRAEQANIATSTISHQDFPTRELFDEKMHEQLIAWNVDLVILAGFMRILSSNFVKKWEGRMVNIHPSLLPAYKGVHTHQRVLHTGDLFHGCTVHFVSSELDSGQTIAQATLMVYPHDSVVTLAKRVHLLEHQIYPLVVQLLCTQQLRLETGKMYLYGQPLEQPIQLSALQ